MSGKDKDAGLSTDGTPTKPATTTAGSAGSSAASAAGADKPKSSPAPAAAAKKTTSDADDVAAIVGTAIGAFVGLTAGVIAAVDAAGAKTDAKSVPAAAAKSDAKADAKTDSKHTATAAGSSGSSAAAAADDAKGKNWVIKEENAVYLTITESERPLDLGTDTGNLPGFRQLNVRDTTKLAALAKTEAAEGNPVALSNYAWCQFFGCWGVPKDEVAAFRAWEAAAAKGSVLAALNQYVLVGSGIPKQCVPKPDKALAYRKFLEFSKAPHKQPIAVLLVAQCLAEGWGVPKNAKAAFAAFTRCAEQHNNADAMWGLALAYCDGEGVDKDLRKSLEWCTKSAELGCCPGQYRLGNLYCWPSPDDDTGEIYPDGDAKKGFEWFQRAAEQGDFDSLMKVAECHAQGVGVEQSTAAAEAIYKRESEAGTEPAAMCHYAFFLGDRGRLQEAFAWYKRAAEMGLASAQQSVGACYEDGEGVEADLEKAREWYEAASRGGDEDAARALRRMNGEDVTSDEDNDDGDDDDGEGEGDDDDDDGEGEGDDRDR